MPKLIVVSLVVCLGAAVVGAFVTGLFSLALISLALLLGAGAVSLTLQCPSGTDEADSPAEGEAAITLLRARRRAQGGGEVSRAA
jgi:hypothetical protein